jgi:hypothetical protein
MPRNGRIPGIAQVSLPAAVMAGLAEKPKPRKAKPANYPKPAPTVAPRAERELDLHMTTDGTGVRVKVGCAYPVAIYPHDYQLIGTMLGMDYAKAINERNAAQSALANRTQERDQARADHGAADVALQDTLKDLEKSQKKAAEWEAAAARNLADFNATKKNLSTLQGHYDALTVEYRKASKSGDDNAAAHAAELARVKTSRLIVCALAVAACIATHFAFGGAR